MKKNEKTPKTEAHIDGELTEQQLESIVAGWGHKKKKHHCCKNQNRTLPPPS